MVDEELIMRDGNDKDEDIYTEEGREIEVDSDVVIDSEAGFVQGFEEGERLLKCSNCGKLLKGEIIESEIDGEIYNFCSEECAEHYQKENK